MREKLEAAIEAAWEQVVETAKPLATTADNSDFVGNPGVRSTGQGSPEDERVFSAARAAYIAAVRAKHSWVYGPARRAV